MRMQAVKIALLSMFVLSCVPPQQQSQQQTDEKILQFFEKNPNKERWTLDKALPSYIDDFFKSKKPAWEPERQTRFINGDATLDDKTTWAADDRKAYAFIAKFRYGMLGPDDEELLKTSADKELYNKMVEERKANEPKPSWFDKWGTPLMLVGVLVVMYFLLIYPQRKQAKKAETERKKLMEALGRGARVETIGGMVGTVVRVNDDEVVVAADKEKRNLVTFKKRAILQVLAAGDGGDKEEKSDAAGEGEKKPENNNN
jgi:preprotein translocase YajC subunit